MSDTPYVHPSAIVEEGAILEEGVKIWHFGHVRPGAHIARGAQLGKNAYVAAGVRVGPNCKIQNNVSLFEGVELEADVFIGPSAVFTNVLTPRAHISRRDEYAPTYVARGVSIGANATIVCGVTIARYAMIGAGSVVTRDVLPFELVVGNPARRLGWVCQCGERLAQEESLAACARCQATYTFRDGEPSWNEEP